MNRKLFVLLTGLLLMAAAAAHAEPRDFPRPAALKPDIDFWKRIYSEVGTDGGLIHDTRDMGIVYEVVKLPNGVKGRARERYTDKIKNRYKAILQTLAKGKRTGLSREEQRVLALFGSGVSNQKLREAASRLRFQLGQADKFRAGIIRSGAYKPHILNVLRRMDLPLEIVHLPHVESSYTPSVYSRIGAAGLWQFTRSTGRRFMQIDHIVDERLDPYLASVAAARLLEQNHRVTGSWPLAITAYNHGAAGMRRASRKLGTNDIVQVVRKYKSRTFGFASRNFYVEFLAAHSIASNPERYFGPLVLDRPIDFEKTKLPFYARSGELARALGVSVKDLKKANPGLRTSVWNGSKHIPKGFEIRIPRGSLPRPLAQGISGIPKKQRYARQTRDASYTVRRGDTLSTIARRHGVRMSQLVALNGLKSRNRIRIGQKLRLPSDTKTRQTVASAPKRKAAPKAQTTTRPDVPAELPDNGIYRVRRGDNLTGIAERFGLSVSELVAVNHLRSRHRIAIGQKLHVVSAAQIAKAATATTASSQSANTSAKTVTLASKKTATAQSNSVASLSPNASPSTAARTVRAETHKAPKPVAKTAASAIAPAPKHSPKVETSVTTASVDSHLGNGSDESAVEPSPGILADPTDYTVASDGTILVQPSETLGHYAEWLGLRASQLRTINKLRYGKPVGIHQKLKLDFSNVSSTAFESVRIEYHRSIQEDFFTRWEIEGTLTHRVGAGESLWTLSTRRFDVPIWLLRQYNPDVNLEALSRGIELTIPKLRERTSNTSNARPVVVHASAAG